MSIVSNMMGRIDDLIKISRGITLDEYDTAMLDKGMDRLNSHFHTVVRRRPVPHPHPPCWPEGYLRMEAEYCRVTIMQKRREFNNAWNDTHNVKFHLQDNWREE